MKARFRFEMPREQSAHLEWSQLRSRCEEEIRSIIAGNVHVSAGAGWVSFAEIEIGEQASLSLIERKQEFVINRLRTVLGANVFSYEAPGQPAVEIIEE